MMRSNTPITPQMAEAAMALAVAIQAIVANPAAFSDALVQADKQRAEQSTLTDEQVAQYNAAIEVINKAPQVNDALVAREAQLDTDIAALREAQQKLADDRAAYNRDVESLSGQQQRANEREGKVSARERLCEDRENNQSRITAQQTEKAAELVALDKSLKKREDALNAITRAAQGDTPA